MDGGTQGKDNQVSRDLLEPRMCNNSTLTRTLETKVLQTALDTFQDEAEARQEIHSSLLELLGE
jgi:hypothetical protein